MTLTRIMYLGIVELAWRYRYSGMEQNECNGPTCHLHPTHS